MRHIFCYTEPYENALLETVWKRTDLRPWQVIVYHRLTSTKQINNLNVLPQAEPVGKSNSS